MNIVVLDGYTENPGDLSWEGFEKLGKLTVYKRTNNSQIISRIGNAEIVITNKTPITKDTIEKCPNIRYIGILATGYNVVDIQEANKRGILVTNIPNYSSNAVAQATIALLLEVCNRVGHHDTEVHKGRWSKGEDFCFWDYPLIELYGKTMGIIGYGNIGKQTARIAKAMGMNVLATSRTNKADSENIAKLVDLEYLLKNADVISLHCPLSDATKEIINQNTISMMKDGIIILNTSRGGLIQEESLAEALNRGKVYAAGVDVASVEPMQEDNPLLHAKNCIITPHIAWAPKETRQRLMNIAVKNLECFLNGKPQNFIKP